MHKFITYLILFCGLVPVLLAQDTQVDKGMFVHKGANVGVFGNLTNEKDSLLNNGHITMMGDSLTNVVPLAGTGTLEMLGNNEQHISQHGIIIVDSLILNNLSNISFDNNIHVARHGAFVNGILYDLYDETVLPDVLPFVSFGKNANVDSLQVRDASHVQGLVKKEGNSNFVFPIGDMGFYRPAIAQNISADTTIAAKYYYRDITFPEDSLEEDVEPFREEFWYVSGSEQAFNLALTHDDRTSIFDPKTDSLKIIAYNKVRQNRYHLIDIDKTIIAQQSRYFASALQTDPYYMWYGFALTSRSNADGLEIQQILTPNGDGNNDFFVIPNIDKYANNRIVIFNRYGNTVYEKEQYDNSWDGTVNKQVVGGNNPNNLLPSGTYFVFFYNNDKLIYKDFVQIVYGY